ncbi:MAG: SemiSWEET family sugar transporter [Propionibacteriaceae bacterium]
MSLLVLVGWTATVVGTVLGIPQLVRTARTRNVEGLSLLGWQAILAINLGWTAHGIRIGQPPQILASALSLVATVPILTILSRELGRRTLVSFVPGLALAVAMVGVDQFLGSAAYGVFAILPGVIAMGGQSVELVRAPHVRGISTLSLLLGALNQTLWAVWAVLLQDSGSLIAILATSALVVFNLVWYLLRRLGLRPLGLTLHTPAAAQLQPDVEPQPSQA